MFEKSMKEGFAIGAFNIDNMDIARAVLKGAENKKSPVILAVSSGSLGFIGDKQLLDMINTLLKDVTVPVALHLDHGKSVDICKKAIDLGYNPRLHFCHISKDITRRNPVYRKIGTPLQFSNIFPGYWHMLETLICILQ